MTKMYLVAGALSLLACTPVLAASHDHESIGRNALSGMHSRDDWQDRNMRDCNKQVNFATGRTMNVCTYEAE